MLYAVVMSDEYIQIALDLTLLARWVDFIWWCVIAETLTITGTHKRKTTLVLLFILEANEGGSLYGIH